MTRHGSGFGVRLQTVVEETIGHNILHVVRGGHLPLFFVGRLNRSNVLLLNHRLHRRPELNVPPTCQQERLFNNTPQHTYQPRRRSNRATCTTHRLESNLAVLVVLVPSTTHQIRMLQHSHARDMHAT